MMVQVMNLKRGDLNLKPQLLVIGELDQVLKMQTIVLISMMKLINF